MSAADMIALVERHMDLETKGDLPGVMATLTPDVTWGTRDTIFHEGAEAVAGHYAGTITPPGRFQVANFQGWADEARQTALGYWDVTRPDGSTYPVIALFEFRDGLIRSERLFHDGSAPGCARG